MKNNHILINGFDRCSVKREDKAWIGDVLEDKKTRIIPVYQSKVLLNNDDKNPGAVFLKKGDVSECSGLSEPLVFLGIYDRIPYFAVGIGSEENALKLSKNIGADFKSIRWIVSLLNQRDCEMLTLAGFMVYWHLRNQYCGKCGSKTVSKEAGHIRICGNESCREKYFPSMDPAVIMLVSFGDQCLLGRQSFWPEKMYSTLAGFVEPGETAEDAVKREIQEEVGIKVHHIEYQGSQPWLFPSSLMLGFTAEAAGKDINIDNNELEDAQWFTREDIRQNPDMLPGRISIARKLIVNWVEREWESEKI